MVDILKLFRKPTKEKLITVEGVWGSPKAWKMALGDNASMRELAEDFYAKNTLVYACVEELATSAAEPRLIVERRAKDGWEEWADCPLQDLLDNPSKQAPKMTAYYMHYGIMMYEAIYGNAFLEKVRSKAGRVVALVPINPERMAYKLTSDNSRLDHWDCAMGQGQTIPLLPEDIIHFRKPNPRNPLMGMSPLSVCLRMAGIDNNQADFVATFFENAAVPFGLLQHKQRLDDSEVARIRERIHEQYRGVSGWHDVMILDAEAEYQPIGQGLDHIDVGRISALPETRICMAFQVPAALVGALVGLEHATNQATLRDWRRSFWEETLGPIYRGHKDQWNLDLVPEFGENLRVRWDFSTVTALQENETEKHNRARADLQAGYILVNEARQAIGLDVVPNGDVFLRPLNIMEIAQTQKAPVKVIEVRRPYELKAGEPDRNLSYWKTLDATAKAWEKPFQREAALQFKSELEGLMLILRKEGKASKAAVPFQLFLFSALDFLQMQGPEWRKGFYPLFEALLTAQGENIAARFGISFDIDSPAVQEFLGNYTMRFSESLFVVDEKAMNSLVSIAQSEGWTVPQLRDAISSEWGGFAKDRAEMIARTETIRSSSAGAKEAMREAGIKRIAWLASSDDRTCDWCLDLDGKTIGIEGSFFKQGDRYTVQDGEGNEHTMTFDYEDIDYPPLHTSCLLPGTRCETASEPILGLRSRYDGEAFELTFADGRQLSVTPNHRILTPNGLVAAEDLGLGDDVIYSPIFERIISSYPDDDEQPALIEDIFRALQKAAGMSTVRVPHSPEDLHGDAHFGQGYIDIVAPDSLLKNNLKASRFEHIGKPPFDAANTTSPLLAGEGGLAAALLALGHATHGGMGSQSIAPVLVGSAAGHHELIGLGASSHLDPILQETPNYRLPANPETLRECILAFPDLISTQNLIGIKRFPFHGDIYDLQTFSTLYIANGIITSNCRCTIVAELED